jgi:hypothetical protein
MFHYLTLLTNFTTQSQPLHAFRLKANGKKVLVFKSRELAGIEYPLLARGVQDPICISEWLRYAIPLTTLQIPPLPGRNLWNRQAIIEIHII